MNSQLDLRTPRGTGEPGSESPSRLALLDPAVVRGIAQRLRLIHLLDRFPERRVWALFMFINGFITIAILAGVAMVSNTPFVFPSLGPTAILLFYTPLSPTASPRHTLYGHAIGIVCGYASLLLLGLHHAPPAIETHVDMRRIMAAALSLALTAGVMILLKAAHPPAGATTLIISLGIVTKPFYLAIIEVAVALLVVQGIVINRLAGLDYPLWAKRVEPSNGSASLSSLAADMQNRGENP
ncbi:MAG: HPP family protein [Acidobacteria bacterium]|nr:MAG: HPP family protein [Acidobacteriota bacterium]